MAKEDKEVNNRPSTLSLFKIFLKTDQKRIITNIVIIAIIVICFSIFLFSWYNYRYQFFCDQFQSKSDFVNDGNESIYLTSYSSEVNNFSNDFLTSAVSEINEYVETEMKIKFNNYSAALNTHLIYLVQNETSFYSDYGTYSLLYYELLPILENSIIEGRMPQNSSELVYLRSSKNTPEEDLQINSTISVTPGFEGAGLKNVTIVGLLNESFIEAILDEGFSVDVIPMIYFRDSQENQLYISRSCFFSSPELYLELFDISHYTSKYFYYELYIDYNIDFSLSVIHNFDKLSTRILESENNLDLSFSFRNCRLFYDLQDIIWSFGNEWTVETIQLLSWSVPIIFIFSVVCLEVFNLGEFEKIIKFKSTYALGIETKELKKIIFYEKSTITTIGIVIGLFLGILFSFFLSFGFQYEVSFFEMIAEPVVYEATAVLFVILLIGSIITDQVLIQYSSELISEIYKKKREKFIKKIIKTQEFAIFIIGIFVAAIGLISLTIVNNNSNLIINSLLFSSLLVIIGVAFTLLGFFLLVARLVCVLWRSIGHHSWKKKYSFLTISLRHLSVYRNNYRRSLLAVLMICLGVTPGIIITKSLNNHISLEAHLDTGCADIFIDDWYITDKSALNNLSSIEGIEKITTVTDIRLVNFEIYLPLYKGYSIQMLVINNVSEFLEVINFELLDDPCYSIEDIRSLENNMTYLMHSKFVKENNYDKDAVFLSSKFTRRFSDPYEMIYINQFDYFPLINTDNLINPNYEAKVASSLTMDYYAFVVSNLTANQLLKKLPINTLHIYRTYKTILIKTLPSANITSIQEEISKQFGVSTTIFSRVEENIWSDINDYKTTLLIAISVIIALTAFFFGALTSRNIYPHRMRIMESAYQMGATKTQLWQVFTLEFLFIIILPTIISMSVAIAILYTSLGFLFNVQENYKQFTPWLPWWLILLIPVITYSLIASGWIFSLIYQVKSYRPLKHE